MTVKEVKKLAYDFAEEVHIPHNFNKEKSSGWDWLARFRKRNPQLSLRSPEPTSAARAQAFNKPQVHTFFNLFFDSMRSENISVDKIYNMDESALTTVQKPSKIFTQKGKKQVGVLTSAGRGQHVIVVCCSLVHLGNVYPLLSFSPGKHLMLICTMEHLLDLSGHRLYDWGIIY